MQSTPRAALMAAAIVATLVAVSAVPGAAVIQSFPGGCRDIDTDDALARGDAVALIVRINGEDQLISPVSEVELELRGPGMNHTEETFRTIEVPGLLTAKLLTSRIDLKIDEDPLRSQAWAQAEVVDLDILNGTITADVVKAWANGETDTHHAFTRSVDSRIVGLQIPENIADFDSSPGIHINLGETTDAIVGNGSFVRTYVREDNSSFPTHDNPVYIADTTVTMLHVYLRQVIGIGEVEIIVSKAHAHAETPTPFCGLVQSVKAAAYVARARPDIDDSTSVLVGEQHIGVVGGRGHHQLLGAQIPVGHDSIGEVNVTESSVFGQVNASVQSEAHAMSKVLGVCILQDGTVAPENQTIEDYGDCLVGITAIRAESHSVANATDQISWGSVTIVGVTVLGVDVCAELGFADENEVEGNNSSSSNICKPPKNTQLDIGPYTIWLNQRERDPPEPGHTGYYVRAFRIQGPIIGDLIISRAYTSADFLDGTSGTDTTLTGSLP